MLARTHTVRLTPPHTPFTCAGVEDCGKFHLVWSPPRPIVPETAMEAMICSLKELAATQCPIGENSWLPTSGNALDNIQTLLRLVLRSRKAQCKANELMIGTACDGEFDRRQKAAMISEASEQAVARADGNNSGSQLRKRLDEAATLQIGLLLTEAASIRSCGCPLLTTYCLLLTAYYY